MKALTRLLRGAGAWMAERLALPKLLEHLRHPVPPETASNRIGWVYVLGFVAVAVFVLQIVTGSALLMRYVPATGAAYESIEALMTEGWAGRLARGMHFWGASAMVLLVILHMARVFLMGAYKYPREMNWITGVILLVLVLAMGFTGQLLRWNQDGLWGVAVASQYAGRVPFVGDAFRRLVLAGDFVGGATLNRFFALHVVILPLLMIGLLGVHLLLVFHHGISEPPRAGDRVDPKTYRERYRAMLERIGRPYWPDAAWQEAVATAVVFVLIFVLAVVVGPRALGEPPDPASVPTHPRPDWFLMWYYALLAIKPRGLEDFTMVHLPILVLIGLILLPIVRGKGERAPSRRPWAVGVVVALALVFGTLTGLGYRGDWVPDLESRPFTAADLDGASEEVLRGAELFHSKNCQSCHVVLGRGGTWGPDLTHVLARMRASTVTDRIVNGIRDMPAFRDAITADELSAILRFLAAAEERAGAGEGQP